MKKLRKNIITLLLLLVTIVCMGCGSTGFYDSQSPSSASQSDTNASDNKDSASDTMDPIPEVYVLPENLDNTDVNYPIPYGTFIPSQNREYRDEYSHFLYNWGADSNIFTEQEVWGAAVATLDKDSVNIIFTDNSNYNVSFENITYKKIRNLSKEELELFSLRHFNMDLDEYYANNTPCTFYDVCAQDGTTPLKVMVFDDRIWLWVCRVSSFRDMDDELWYLDDLHLIIEFVPESN